MKVVKVYRFAELNRIAQIIAKHAHGGEISDTDSLYYSSGKKASVTVETFPFLGMVNTYVNTRGGAVLVSSTCCAPVA